MFSVPEESQITVVEIRYMIWEQEGHPPHDTTGKKNRAPYDPKGKMILHHMI